MPKIQKVLNLEISPEQFLSNCSEIELMETQLLLQSKKYQDKINDSEAIAIEDLTKIRSCRVCGCTDKDCTQCIEKTGSPCYWVAKDLCSACMNEMAPIN